MITVKRVIKIKLYWNHKTGTKICPVNNCSINSFNESLSTFINSKESKFLNDQTIIGQIKYGINNLWNLILIFFIFFELKNYNKNKKIIYKKLVQENYYE